MHVRLIRVVRRQQASHHIAALGANHVAHVRGRHARQYSKTGCRAAHSRVTIAHMNEQSVPEEIVAKVLSLLPRYSTVEGLMETGQFDCSNTIHAALRILQARGKVQARDLYAYDPELAKREEQEEAQRKK